MRPDFKQGKDLYPTLGWPSGSLHDLALWNCPSKSEPRPVSRLDSPDFSECAFIEHFVSLWGTLLLGSPVRDATNFTDFYEILWKLQLGNDQVAFWASQTIFGWGNILHPYCILSQSTIQWSSGKTADYFWHTIPKNMRATISHFGPWLFPFRENSKDRKCPDMQKWDRG